MSELRQRPLRIAHAYGNRRDKIEAAAAADIDFLEADVWHRAGEFWVRHEGRLGFLPILVDRLPQGVDSAGPWAFPLFPRYYMRLDVDPLSLRELIQRTSGKRRLLLDLKNRFDGERSRTYAESLTGILAEAGCEDSVIVCGQTSALDGVRQVAPHIQVCYSVERQPHWETFLQRLETGPDVRGVCIRHQFLTDAIFQFVRDNGLHAFCWTVDDPEEARRLVEMGVDGIISNSLSLLEGLGRA